jgi:hypothetical protein
MTLGCLEIFRKLAGPSIHTTKEAFVHHLAKFVDKPIITDTSCYIHGVVGIIWMIYHLNLTHASILAVDSSAWVLAAL